MDRTTKSKRLLKRSLEEITVKVDAYFEKIEAKYGSHRVAKYPCPHCQGEIKALRPEETGEVWDSMVQCNLCGKLHFKVIDK